MIFRAKQFCGVSQLQEGLSGEVHLHKLAGVPLVFGDPLKFDTTLSFAVSITPRQPHFAASCSEVPDGDNRPVHVLHLKGEVQDLSLALQSSRTVAVHGSRAESRTGRRGCWCHSEACVVAELKRACCEGTAVYEHQYSRRMSLQLASTKLLAHSSYRAGVDASVALIIMMPRTSSLTNAYVFSRLACRGSRDLCPSLLSERGRLAEVLQRRLLYWPRTF